MPLEKKILVITFNLMKNEKNTDRLKKTPFLRNNTLFVANSTSKLALSDLKSHVITEFFFKLFVWKLLCPAHLIPLTPLIFIFSQNPVDYFFLHSMWLTFSSITVTWKNICNDHYFVMYIFGQHVSSSMHKLKI
jgi:hypothetical protein